MSADSLAAATKGAERDSSFSLLTWLIPRLPSHQFGVAPAVQYKVLWFEVSVDDAFGMQVGEGLHHTRRVESGRRVVKRTPGSERRICTVKI